MISLMNTQDSLHAPRHSLAHLLASVILDYDPKAQLGIGPVIENGFYYDFLFSKPVSENQLTMLENKMRALIKKNIPFKREELSVAEGKALFANQPFKLELISDIETKGTTAVEESLAQFPPLQAKAGQAGKNTVSIYKTGSFVDLCQGPHVEHSGKIKADAFKLTKLAGAYWRGSEKNPMLTRIYGVAFATKKELDEYLALQAEAEKRNHRKLGKELELFTLIDQIGPGLPLFYPKGAMLRRLIENYIADLQEQNGYLPIWIPHITKGELYRISGHLDKYDAMYPPMDLKDEAQYYLKPMNCPHFMMLYKTTPHSYRELPVRWTCTTTNYRYEKSGELSGLTRVRALTQDDCHVFVMPDQIEQEINTMLGMIKTVYKTFGFKDFWVRISTHDPKNKEQYIGDPKIWKESEALLAKLIAKHGWKHEVGVGEAAFYGPKLDFMFRDALGRQWQLSTIQLDMNLPARFELEYTDKDGSKKQPIVIHRAILGSTERFLGILIEHLGGMFPLWLAPVQAYVMPIGKGHKKYAKDLYKQLIAAGIRAELKDDDETIGKKIRIGEQQKIPYMLIIGDKEIKSKSASVRTKGKDKGAVKIKKLLDLMQQEIEKKK